MLKYYPQYNWDEVVDEIPMQRGWAMIAVATKLDGWNQFCGLKLKKGSDYLSQEVQVLVKEQLDYNKEKGI